MSRRGASGDRHLALFFLGVFLLSPPFLTLFSGDGMVFGVPLLFIYLFAAWGVLILLMALASEGRRRFRGGRHRSSKPLEG